MFGEFDVEYGWHTFVHLVTIEAKKLQKALGNNHNKVEIIEISNESSSNLSPFKNPPPPQRNPLQEEVSDVLTLFLIPYLYAFYC